MRDMSELHKSKPPPSGRHHKTKKRKKLGSIFLLCFQFSGHINVENRGVMELIFISVNYRNPMPEIDRLMQVRLYVNSCISSALSYTQHHELRDVYIIKLKREAFLTMRKIIFLHL
jgi:hypothetical protein